MKPGTLVFQIGKNGLTKTGIEHLASAFKTRRVVKVQLLKSAISDRSKIEEVAQTLISELPGKYNYRVIGFTIILMKRSTKN
ncbi:MAG: YhbY family RNA-binding protein [Nanoarchaeota archaeon]